MKKFLLVFLLVVALGVLTVSVASAEPPPGVGPAVRMEETGFTGWTYQGSTYLAERCVWQFSNGAQGRAFFKCSSYLALGSPIFEVIEEFAFDYGICSPGDDIFTNFDFDGDKLTTVTQCSGLWSP
jgi:hypothetical protein